MLTLAPALFCFVAVPAALAQLTGPVGPLTSLATKQGTICNVLDYGGSIGSDDIGPAIQSAFNDCIKSKTNSTLLIPEGEYGMKTWVTLSGGQSWAFQLDGFITRTNTDGGHMIIIKRTSDFEMLSSTSSGGFQGHGFECRNSGPRFLRVVLSNNWSVHDLVFVDSPAFHIIVDQGSNGELYNIAIRGAEIGGSDGIDISGTNHWVHDVTVTNKDECVTVKSPSSGILIERIWCNYSGGSAIGSLGGNTSIANIVYRDIYTSKGNQAMMLKSNGGGGFVDNVLMENFITHGAAYALDIDQYWSSMNTLEGEGVTLTNFVFKNWTGSIPSSTSRPTVKLDCADGAPCSNFSLSDINLWAEDDTQFYRCRSAYGTGAPCLPDTSEAGTEGTATSYEAITTVYSKPTSTIIPTMEGDLTAGFGSTASIPVPVIPTAFFPGLPQISPLAKNLGTTSSSGTASTSPTPTATASASGSASSGGPSSSFGALSSDRALTASTSDSVAASSHILNSSIPEATITSTSFESSGSSVIPSTAIPLTTESPLASSSSSASHDFFSGHRWQVGHGSHRQNWGKYW